MMNTTNVKGFLVGALTAVLITILSWPAIADNGIVDNGIADDGERQLDIATVPQQPTVVQSFGDSSPVVIPAAAFVADGASPDSHFFPFSGGYFQGGAGNYGCLVAPAYLPSGARLTEIFASVYDNDATRAISVALRRVDNFADSTDTMATLATTVADAFDGVQVVSDITIDDNLVDYPSYSYYLTTCVGSADIRLYSVRIYYTRPEAYIPYMEKN